jgi:hypothetical protein
MAVTCGLGSVIRSRRGKNSYRCLVFFIDLYHIHISLQQRVCHEDACGQIHLDYHRKEQVPDEEYPDPRKVLESEDASITVASSSREIAIGMLGARVKLDV